MNLFDMIEDIMISKRLKTKDFLAKTGISRGAYYAMKDGRTKTISMETAIKINNAFPEYSVQKLINTSENVSQNLIKHKSDNNKEDLFLEYKGVKVPFELVGMFVANNFDKFFKEHKLINAVVKNELNHRLEKICEENDIEIKYKSKEDS